MRVCRKPEHAFSWSREVRRGGAALGLVPTMGALHEGHLSLIRLAKKRAGRVMVTLFVNPTQFGPGEDYDAYPRTEEADFERCASEGVDAVFAPASEAMYDPDHCTNVSVEGSLTEGLCGASRPGHFRGVTTVVLKLFSICEPDLAVFGMKDYQQFAVIRRMGRDLNLPIEIIGAPTYREPDGLAMSSRNAYLSPMERAAAPVLYQTLRELKNRVLAGERDAKLLERDGRSLIESGSGGRVEYLDFVDPDSLTPVSEVRPPCLAALAVFLGSTRLIDNLLIEGA